MTEAVMKIETENNLPAVRGNIKHDAPLGSVGWFRAGGKAEILFKPADLSDLQDFLKDCPADVPVTVFGVMSNSIIRDGGVKGVVVRMGREFATIEAEMAEDTPLLKVGALALDGNVAQAAAKAGIAGLEFYSGIPGTIGGALRMNAGCYGTETKDVLVSCEAVDRAGNLHVFTRAPMSDEECAANIGPGGAVKFISDRDENLVMTLSYRHNDLPAEFIFTSAVFEGTHGEPEAIKAAIQEIKARRTDSQPIREKTGGSTFANPTAEEIATAGLPEGTKVWQIIDRAGCRGLQIGGAQMSKHHCNFMINTGDATAADLEALGEEVRRRVYEDCGITLRWEVRRVGEQAE